MKRNVLITGVAGGIGYATARAFVKAGWKVIGIDKHDMVKRSNSIVFLKGDISNAEVSKKLFKDVSDNVKKLDVIVNNAAVQICKPITKMNPNEWDSVMETNLRSVFLSVRHGYKLIRKPGGSIVNVSSVHALATSTNIAAYAASKGAVLALTRAIALELAGEGIRVNAVLPGAVDTQMLRSGLSRGHIEGHIINDMLKSLCNKIPLRRIGQPEEIAQSILFLADNKQSSFITGEALVVDGGALARLSTE